MEAVLPLGGLSLPGTLRIVRKRPEDLSEEEWHWTVDVCLTSAFRASKAAYPEFGKAGGGKILNNGSIGTGRAGMDMFEGVWTKAEWQNAAKNGLSIKLESSVRYRAKSTELFKLHTTIGPE